MLVRIDLPLRMSIEALSSDLRLAPVARGPGISLATRTAIESSPPRDDLQIVPVQGFEPGVRVGYCYSITVVLRLIRSLMTELDAIKRKRIGALDALSRLGPARSVADMAEAADAELTDREMPAPGGHSMVKVRRGTQSARRDRC